MSNYNERQTAGNGGSSSNLGLPEFERAKMQQAIDELGEKCRTLREENKKLDAENNFFHLSTGIFLKMKPVNNKEK